MSNQYANNITRLSEYACKEYLKTIPFDSISPENIVSGFDYDELPSPRIVCCCNNATPVPPADDALWECDMEIEVISNVDEQRFEAEQDAHHSRSGEVFSQFFQGRYDTASAMTNAAQAAGINWACQDILASGQTKEVQNRQFRSKLLLKIICYGIAIAGIILPAAAAPPTIPTDSLVAFWDFEGMSNPGIVPDTINAINLVAIAGGDPDAGSANPCTGAVGDGIIYAGHGDAQDNLLLFTDNFSLSMWVYYDPRATEADGHLIAGNTEWNIRRMIDGAVVFTRIGTDGNSAKVMANDLMEYPVGIADGWYHIVVTSNGEAMTVRLSRNSNWFGTRGVTAGGNFTGTSNHFLAGPPSPSIDATVDEIRLYSRALTESEELALFIETGLSYTERDAPTLTTPDAAVLVAHWNCDSVTGGGLTLPATSPGATLDLTVLSGGGLFLAGLAAVGADSVDITGNVLSNGSAALDLGESFSISFWLYPLAAAASPIVILGKVGQYLVEYADQNIWLRRNAVHHDAVYDVVNGGPGYSMVSVKAPVETVLNTWNHIVVTSQAGRITARVSVRGDSFGAEAENVGNMPYEAQGSEVFKLGNASLVAACDEIRVYTGVLTEAQQQALYNAT